MLTNEQWANLGALAALDLSTDEAGQYLYDRGLLVAEFHAEAYAGMLCWAPILANVLITHLERATALEQERDAAQAELAALRAGLRRLGAELLRRAGS